MLKFKKNPSFEALLGKSKPFNFMFFFDAISPLQEHIRNAKNEGKTVGLVPTMGALHKGHLSLVEKALEMCDVVVATVFVNPTQFNESSDFSAYPRTLDNDSELLAEAGCHVLFAPNVETMYPTPDHNTYSFGTLEHAMEGANRPGHFNGVGMVIKRLFEVIKPNAAFFGEKDFQQLLVIRSLNEQYNLNVEVVGCSIVREANGLAMSSRNMRLSEKDLNYAVLLGQLLNMCRTKAVYQTAEEIAQWAFNILEDDPHFKPEYVTIADANSLETLSAFVPNQPARIFVAAWIGGVRLIDNMPIFP